MKKLLLFIVALVALNVSLHAQDAPACDYQVGDSVMVNPDTTHYMTGEKISSWVYTVKHAIEQIESVFHPDGILLKGIKSWVHRNAIISDKPRAAAKPSPEAVVTEQPKSKSEEQTTEPAKEQTQVAVAEDKTAEVVTHPETTAPVATQPTRLVGRVVSSDNRAIANATITLANQGITTTTNENGEFTLTYLDPTDEEVILEANGYISDIQLIQFTSEGTS